MCYDIIGMISYIYDIMTYDIIGKNYDIIGHNYDIIVQTMISGVPRFQMIQINSSLFKYRES